MASIDVLILGGGFAGLSAASALAARGARVTVLERRPRPGGRASSFHDPRAGGPVDNGQHLFMGCYRETLRFLERIGSRDLLRLEPDVRLAYAEPGPSGPRRYGLRCPTRLPAPFHLVAALLSLGGVPAREKAAAWRLGAWFRRLGTGPLPEALDRSTVAEWLTSLGQPERLQEVFYFPIAFGALNEDPRRASALGFAQALRGIFFADASAARFGLSRVPLSELYVPQAETFLRARGGSIEPSRRAVSVRRSGSRFSVACETGSFEAERVVCALPPWELAKLELPAPLREGAWKALKPSPIIGINLWYDRPVVQDAMTGLIGTEVQWVFDRSRLWGLPGPGQALALVLSGAHRRAGSSPRELLELALREMRLCFPAAEKAKMLHWTAVKEPFATLSPTPGSESLRPGQDVGIPGLVLAGDWVRTGLPATIESAVLSGHRAAELILGGRDD